ncbi:MAG: PaaI family thioesterase [Ancalomicrobiaceae bacterium]|nr:PaaI family thioesterase [Ancalomicrobiaceae bacterium]
MSHKLKMTAEEIAGFLDAEYPEMHEGGQTIFVETVDHAAISTRFKAGERHLRPGGTVSGPWQFTLADITGFVALLAHLGPVALAVTTSATINFLRRPPPGDLIATARILKKGRSLVVVDVSIAPAGSADLVSHAVLTYSLPPAKQ